MSEGKMSENSFMVENCASLPVETLLNIASYMIGNEGGQRLKQCKALRVLQRKWKPFIHTGRVGESRYYALVSNKCLKGDKALSYVLKPPKELLRMMKYDEEIGVGIEVSSKIMYNNNNICNCRSYSSSKQNRISSRASLQFYIEKIVEEIKQTMKRNEIITIEHIAFEILHNRNNDFMV